VGRITTQGDGFLWEHEDAEQAVSQSMSGEELVENLQKVAAKQRCDLYARKQMPPKDALKAGAGAANEIMEVFEALVPLYDTSVGA
jgi:uncharacterized protein YktB (UPF0637 family)